MDSAGAMCLLSVLCHFTAHRAASWQNWTDTVVTFLKVCVDCSRKNGNHTFFFVYVWRISVYLQGGERLSNQPSGSFCRHRHWLCGVCSLVFNPHRLCIYRFWGWYISFHLSHSYIWFLCLFMKCSSNNSMQFGVSFIARWQ